MPKKTSEKCKNQHFSQFQVFFSSVFSTKIGLLNHLKLSILTLDNWKNFKKPPKGLTDYRQHPIHDILKQYTKNRPVLQSSDKSDLTEPNNRLPSFEINMAR